MSPYGVPANRPKAPPSIGQAAKPGAAQAMKVAAAGMKVAAAPPPPQRQPKPAPVAAPVALAQPAAPSAVVLPGPEFFAEAEALFAVLETVDYFQLFKLDPASPTRAIKDAYYRESRAYHPDRFNSLPDEAMKEKIGSIFKRVTEAYVVLRDETKRAKYAKDLAGAERDKKLRFTEASEVEAKAEAKKAVEEQTGTTPKGREAFKSGMKEFDGKRWDAALRHFKMALMYEPANAKYKEQLNAAQSELDKSRPKNDFRIK